MTLRKRTEAVLRQLSSLPETAPDGRRTLDTGKIAPIVRRDPDAVIYGVRTLIHGGLGTHFGWTLLHAIADAFRHEFDDDSMAVFVSAAASEAVAPAEISGVSLKATAMRRGDCSIQ
jgi:hypothetical protein